MRKLSYIAEYKRLLGFLRPHTPSYWLGLLGSSAIGSTFTIIMAFVFKNMIDAAQKGDTRTLWQSGLLITVSVVVVNLITPLFNALSVYTVDRGKTSVFLSLYQKLMRLPMSYYEKNHSGDIISRVNFEVNDATGAFSHYLQDAFGSIFTGMFSAIALFVLDYRFGIIVVSLGVVALWLNKRFAPTFQRLNTIKNQAARNWLVQAMDVLAGMSTIRLFGNQNSFRSKYAQAAQDSATASINRGRAHANMEACNHATYYLSFVIVIALGVWMVSDGLATFGTVIAVTQLLSGVSDMFTKTGAFITLTQRSLASAVRLYEILDADEEPVINAAIDKKHLGVEEKDASPVVIEEKTDSAVVIKGASFSYDGQNQAIQDVTLEIPNGKMVALVGSSGGGKSTLLKLIMGFYPLDQGEIVIGGRSMSGVPLEEIRRMLAYVPQEAYLFQGTIAENIAHGSPGASEERIEEAAKKANAYDFIVEQPQGFHTQVGERGGHLSGGQRQRIAIARAFIKDAPILLLDEATASLDSQNERMVQDAISRLMKGRTTVIVAHRLSTIQSADVIAVIENGRIVELGDHEELIARHGRYAALYRVQFA